MRATLTEKRKKIYVVITYEDSLGQTKKKWFGTGLNAVRANRKEANRIKEEKLEEFKQIYKFADNKKSTMLFADFITDWLERVKPNLQISTYSSYAMQVKEIANYFRIKKIKLLDLQPLDIANFYAYLQKQGKSVQKCEHLHVNIRKCLQSAVKANLIQYNPADRIDRPKSPIHISQFYTKEELEKFFACLDDDNYAYIYKMTAYYGLRRSEMVGIKWDSIDFKKNTITLKHSVVQTRLNGKSVIVAKDRLKNSSSFRTLPLIPEIKEILLELKKKQERNMEMYGKQYCHKYDDYICVDDLGYRINPETVSSHFKIILRKNNLKNIRFHELRHSCASLLLEQGVAMKEIQEWLGHSSYTTTANIYSHLDSKAKTKVANVISKAFGMEELKIEESGRDEKITGTKPRYISKVKHRDNSTTVELDYKQTPENVGEILEENQTEKPIREKSVKVYVNVDTGYLGATKRFSDLEDNHKFLKEIKSTEEANDFIVELFCSGEYDKNDLKEYRSRLLKKVKEICEDSEM